MAGIVGITHDKDGASIDNKFRVSGKAVIGETVGNAPVSLGYWKLKRLSSTTRSSGGKEAVVKTWETDQILQNRLCEMNKSDKPTKLPIRIMDSHLSNVFTAEMQKFGSNNRVLCRSFGLGTPAMELTRSGEDFVSKPRVFEDGSCNCPLFDCPDFKKKNGGCKANGYFKFYLNLGAGFDDFLYPFQFHTTSPTSIREINETLEKISNMVKFAASLDAADGKDVPFVGLFGIRIVLTVIPTMVNGKKVDHIKVDLHKEDKKMLSEKISQGFNKKVQVNGIEMNVMQAATLDLLGNGLAIENRSEISPIDLDEATDLNLIGDEGDLFIGEVMDEEAEATEESAPSVAQTLAEQ